MCFFKYKHRNKNKNLRKAKILYFYSMKQSALQKFRLKLSRAWHKQSFYILKKLLQFMQYFCFLLVPYQLYEKNIFAALAFMVCCVCCFHARESIQKFETELVLEGFDGNRRERRAKWHAIFRAQRKIRGW